MFLLVRLTADECFVEVRVDDFFEIDPDPFLDDIVGLSLSRPWPLLLPKDQDEGRTVEQHLIPFPIWREKETCSRGKL